MKVGKLSRFWTGMARFFTVSANRSFALPAGALRRLGEGWVKAEQITLIGQVSEAFF
jgi:hypothetical protein